MNQKLPATGTTAKLRSQAEAMVRNTSAIPPEGLQAMTQEESLKIIHELNVHQFELQIQNEELSRVQAELEEARAHYFDLYHLAPIGYYILSYEGLILEANLTAVNMLDLALSTLVMKPIRKFIFKEDQDIYYLHRKQLYETHRPAACELRMVKKDGTPFWVQLTSAPTESPTESGMGKSGHSACRVVVSDITERKRVQEENARLLAQLQQVRQPPTEKQKPG
jgi:PAS domain S-box-containing protein